jgi:uncharacterized protein YjhX (UPF0386 family)
MATVVIGRIQATPSKGGKIKRVRDASGQLITIRTIDADSRSFGSELRDVFAKNVSKARKANKAAVGSPDHVRAKA